MATPRSSLAHYCIALRTARGLTQTQLASRADVHISTLKNVEGDRPVSISTYAQVYRRGLSGKDSLTEEEWHKLIGYWLFRALDGDVQQNAIGAGLRTAGEHVTGAAEARRQAVLGALGKLSEPDATVLASLAKALTSRRGPALLTVLRGVLDL